MDEILKELDKLMKKQIDFVVSELSRLKTGRANASILDGIRVEYYQQLTPLDQVAMVQVLDPHTLGIQPWDKSVLVDIKKAIEKSNLGITPVVDTDMVRISMPPLTEERRKEIVKILKQKIEENKVKVRNIRKDILQTLKKEEKDNNLSQDQVKGIEKKIQTKIDETIEMIDSLSKKKEKELLSLN